MKKALLVGINAYPSPNELQGCVNDVTNMRDVLIKYFDFEVDNIRLLIDSRATKANIMEHLQWLVYDEKNFTKLFYHNSSHGSQIRDINGDELRDHLDEIICPVDFNWDGNFITDDELSALFKTITTKGKLEVVMDSCHAGTVTRNQFISVDPVGYKKSRFITPPIDILCRIDEDRNYKKNKLLRGMSKAEEELGHILFAGCKDYQTCADAYIGGSYNGAFTYYFCKTIRSVYNSTGSFIKRADLISRVNRSLRYGGYSQIAQIEGSRMDKNLGMFN
jgi:hypothetical protein